MVRQAANWTWASIEDKCGARAMGPRCTANEVKLYKVNQQAELWGGLENMKVHRLGITTVKDLLRRQKKGTNALYLHDSGLEMFCPRLMTELKCSKYFPVDYLQLPPAALRLTSHSCPSAHDGVGASMHPSLFMGPRGTRSTLHADDAGSRFMMGVIQGRQCTIGTGSIRHRNHISYYYTVVAHTNGVKYWECC